MRYQFLSLTILCAACLISSCVGNKNVVIEDEVKVVPDKLVARVSSVNSSSGYVLIQRLGRLVIPEDAILYTLGSQGHETSVASIKVTGERLGQFLAADIVTGELIVGDAVYLRTFEKEQDSDN